MATNIRLADVPKVVKHVLSHIIFTSYAQNVCLQNERKHVDAGAMSRNRTFNEQRDSDCSLVLDASSQFVDI